MTFEFAIAHPGVRHDGPLRIVQVGAFDGSANDRLVDVLARFGCEAVLIEPQPGPFRKLAALHSRRKNV